MVHVDSLPPAAESSLLHDKRSEGCTREPMDRFNQLLRRLQFDQGLSEYVIMTHSFDPWLNSDPANGTFKRTAVGFTRASLIFLRPWMKILRVTSRFTRSMDGIR